MKRRTMAVFLTRCVNNITAHCMGMVILIMLLAVMALTGCGQQGAAGTSTGQDGEGALYIALTDAPGDFLNYTVDVVDLTMTKANGAQVHLVPLTTRLDFTQYTELSEFLTAAMVPAGVYTHATLTLDYQDAGIWVENESGETVQVSNIEDMDGNPIGILEVSVRLEGRNRLVIVPGVPSHMTFDFNLNASNKVRFDPETSEPTVVVEPFLLADVELQRPKIHRLRGPLKDVNVAGGTFEMILRPFRHTNVNDRRFGTMNVHTSGETLYEIDQQDYTGREGLEALDAMPAFTATIVIGDLKFNPWRFVATEVYAGSSVPGGTLDVVKGTVLARSGNVITVKGATLIRAGGSVIFNDRVLVQLADTTRVKKQLSHDMHSIVDISVGQRVSVFGTLTNQSSTALELDATDGLVRLLIGKLRATANEVIVDQDQKTTLVADLQSINHHRRIALFDFDGTGSTPENDADPTNYEINASTMDLSALAADTPIVVRGFVTPFGTAPADYDALSVVDLSKVPAVLATNWRPSTATPFTAISVDGMTLNLDGAGLFHHVGRNGVVTDLTSLAVAPSIVPKDADDGVYVIRQGFVRQLYTNFASFIEGLESRLAEGELVMGVGAAGLFSDNDGTLTAHTVHVKMPANAIN